MRFRYFVALACAVLLFSMTTYAQVSVNGSLRGRVTDAQGAAVPNAAATLVNAETNQTQTAATGDDGAYFFPRVAPGIYQLRVAAENFKTAVRDRVTVTVNETVTVNLALAVGAVSETVTIEADTDTVRTQSAEVSQLVNEKRIKELPLNGKNFILLLPLAPGVGGGSRINPSINGGRAAANTYLIDGFSASDERTSTGISTGGGSGFDEADVSVPNLVSTEALREFRVITSNADATFGRSSGGQINIITKQGTNEFHGSLYEYLRNDALDARDFFNTGPIFDAGGRAKTPPFKQHLFGGTFGGKIIRDRHFFFGNYEGFRQRRQQTGTGVVPNAALINLIPGDLGLFYRRFYVERGIVPTQGNPVGSFSPFSATDRAAAIAAGFPSTLFDGNQANGEAGTALVTNALRRDIRQDSFLIRTDHQFGNKLSAYFRYGFAQPKIVYSEISTAPQDVSEDPRRWQSFIAQGVYIISPTQLLEFRAGAQRSNYRFHIVREGFDRASAGLRSDAEGLIVSAPTVGLTDISLTQTPDLIDAQTVSQGGALHTLTRGNLTLRSGFELRRLNINFANLFGQAFFYSFDGLVGDGFLLGSSPGQSVATSSFVSGTIFGAGSGSTTARRGYRATQAEYFTQADWRVSPRLTLNLGLRYTDFGVYSEVNGALSNLYATDTQGNIVPDVSPFAFGRTRNRVAVSTGGLPFYQPDRNNFQPRLGAAYDITGRGTSVVRAAYGLYFDRLYHFVFSATANNIPLAFSASGFGVPFRLGEPPALNPGTPSFTAVDPGLRNPYVHRFNFSFEQQLDRATTITVSYAGSRGRKLLRLLEPNGSGSVPLARRPDPRFSDQRFITNYSASDYHSLQIFGQRRLTNGIDLTAAYTFARSTDDFSFDRQFVRIPSLLNLGASPAPGFQGGGSQFAPLPRAADRGRSDFDVRHSFTFSHLIDLPFGKDRRFLKDAGRFVNALLGGLSLSGIGTFATGTPVNIVRGIDYNDDGTSGADRPALIGRSLADIYARGAQGRTQFFVPREQALLILNTPANVTDPFAPVARNSFNSPPVRFYDVSLIKHLAFNEARALRLELNFFNVTNTPNFAAPIANLNNARFGQITQTRAGTNPRQLQLGIKFIF